MKPPHDIDKKHHDYDSALESDALWAALAESPVQEASTNFTQNTVRAARIAQEHAPSPWSTLLMKPFLAIGSATALLLIGALLVSGPGNEPPSTSTASSDNDWLNTALISTAIAEPDLFSDEEIVAMLF